MLTLNNVSYRYENTKRLTLNGVNGEFQIGKLYAIIGKSGSGKTTLLSMLSGLDTATNGDIIYGCNNLRELDRDAYRAKSIGVIFQGYNLLTNATAIENILFSMDISGSREKDRKGYAYFLLEQLGIDYETANRKILKLSGGEQQRIGIARALSHNPKIIIADEPTGNLDSETEQGIMEIFVKLAHEQSKCVIIVTHSKKVSSYADEVRGIADGKLLFIK